MTTLALFCEQVERRHPESTPRGQRRSCSSRTVRGTSFKIAMNVGNADGLRLTSRAPRGLPGIEQRGRAGSITQSRLPRERPADELYTVRRDKPVWWCVQPRLSEWHAIWITKTYDYEKAVHARHRYEEPGTKLCGSTR